MVSSIDSMLFVGPGEGDGIALGLVLDHFTLGLASGTQPELESYGYSTQIRGHGGFVSGDDHRRDIRLYRNQVTPENEFDDLYRQGMWAGSAMARRVGGGTRDERALDDPSRSTLLSWTNLAIDCSLGGQCFLTFSGGRSRGESLTSDQFFAGTSCCF